MAFLTANAFYIVEILPTSDSAWSSVTAPGASASLMAYIVSGEPIMIYVIDATTGTFIHAGGVETGFDDVLLRSSSAVAELTVTDSLGISTIYSGPDEDNNTYTRNPAEWFLRVFDGAQMTALKAFLP